MPSVSRRIKDAKAVAPLATRLSMVRAAVKVMDIAALEAEIRKHHEQGRLEEKEMYELLIALAKIDGCRRAREAGPSASPSGSPSSAPSGAQLSMSRVKEIVDFQMQSSGRTTDGVSLADWQLRTAGKL